MAHRPSTPIPSARCAHPSLVLKLASVILLGSLGTLVGCGGGGAGQTVTGTDANAGGTTGGGGTGLPAGLPDPVVQAVRTGNALTGASADDFIKATLATMDAQRTAGDPMLAQLYNLNGDGSAKADGSSLTSLSWNPTRDAILMAATFGVNTEVLVTNADGSGNPSTTAKGLGVAGELSSRARYLILGANPMHARGNAQMDAFTANSLRWLTRKASDAPLKVAIVQTSDDTSKAFPYEGKIRQWLTATLGSKVSFNDPDVLDGDNLGKVVTDGYDLVITSGTLRTGQDAATVFKGLKSLLDAGKPLLYVQAGRDLGDLGSQILDQCQVTFLGNNYWSALTINAQNGAAMTGRMPANLLAIRETLSHLLTGTYDFGLGTWQANVTESAAYDAQFGAGALAVKAMMNGFDASGVDVFRSSGREVPKLLALLGDRLRQDIAYPYKVASSSRKDFLRAYFADHAVYNTRAIVPAQKDLGTFSREDFSTVTPVTRTINLVSRPYFRATGAYALPGRTVKVTRLDSSTVNTSLYLNSLRSSSTKEWDDTNHGGYCRPKWVRTAGMPIKPGQTLTFTSCHGGPILIAFDDKDQPVQFRFEQVGEHPYWNGPEDDATFATQLADAKFDWVEVSTAGFEMHSKLDRFKTKTLSSPFWNTPVKLAAAVQRYTYNCTHVLAGFQGDGIDKEPEVYGWATTHGITLPTTDVVKHMNADVATCGAGCSGNPYDADWAFMPIGHGDLHELGHGLQIGKWLLNQGGKTYEGHAGTNFYSYYAQARFFDDTGSHPGGQGMPYDVLYRQLQAGVQAGDRPGTFSTAMETYMSTALNIYNSYAFYIQFMMQVRDKGLLNNGWHMMGRIQALSRAFDAAKKDQATWDREKVKWGFDRISFADAQALNNTNFMAIAMSYTTGLDIRDYMAMWGFRVSDAASAQVASYGFPAAERVYYALSGNNWADGALTTRVDRFIKLPVDGVTAWPMDASLKVSKTTYTTAEAVSVTFTAVNPQPKDWIGIYPATQEPGPDTTALQRKYLDGAKSGTVAFTGLPAGSYKAYLCANDDDIAIEVVAFTVK